VPLLAVAGAVTINVRTAGIVAVGVALAAAGWWWWRATQLVVVPLVARASAASALRAALQVDADHARPAGGRR
jgi:hypothetical protein